MRIALVHDWITGLRGGEKVLSLLCRLMPQADLLTLIHTPGSGDRHIERMRIKTSFLNALPRVRRYYRYLLPAMPLAIEAMDALPYDLIVSLSHCVAKGVIRRRDSAHACYCFTPMRYVWSQESAYRGQMGPAGRLLRAAKGYFRAWDLRSAGHVDLFMSNSRNVAERINRVYHRHADVVYSPIDTEYYTLGDRPREDFYLMVTALAPYKRADQAIEACRRLGRPLKVIGSGQQAQALRRNCPPNVELLGWQSDEVVRDHYRRCRAFLFPGEEDFGLTPLEAMACGAPVIAYGVGGALETVLDVDGADPDGPTGLLYAPQTVEGLAEAIERFEGLAGRFRPDRLSAWAGKFGPERFYEEFKHSIRPLLARKGLPEPWSNATVN